MSFFVVSIVAHMGIVGMMEILWGISIHGAWGNLYLNIWLVSSDMLWIFANTTRYKPILGGFVGVVVLDYGLLPTKKRLKMDCRACEGDCVK